MFIHEVVTELTNLKNGGKKMKNIVIATKSDKLISHIKKELRGVTDERLVHIVLNISNFKKRIQDVLNILYSNKNNNKIILLEVKNDEDIILEYYIKKGIYINIIHEFNLYKPYMDLVSYYRHNCRYHTINESVIETRSIISTIEKYYDDIYYCLKYDDCVSSRYYRIRYLFNNDEIKNGSLGGYISEDTKLSLLYNEFPIIYKNARINRGTIYGKCIIGDKNEKYATIIIDNSTIDTSFVKQGEVINSTIRDSSIKGIVSIFNSLIKNVHNSYGIFNAKDSEIERSTFENGANICDAYLSNILNLYHIHIEQNLKIWINNTANILFYNNIGSYRNITIYYGDDKQIYITIGDHNAFTIKELKKKTKYGMSIPKNDKKLLMAILKYAKKYFKTNSI